MHVLLRAVLHGDAAEHPVLRSSGTGKEQKDGWNSRRPAFH